VSIYHRGLLKIKPCYTRKQQGAYQDRLKHRKGIKMTKHYHFFKLPHEVFEDERLKKVNQISVKWLLVVLCKLASLYGETDNWFFRSMSTLEKDTGMSEHTVRKAKNILRKLELIEVKKGQYIGYKKRRADYYKVICFKRKDNQE